MRPRMSASNIPSSLNMQIFPSNKKKVKLTFKLCKSWLFSSLVGDVDWVAFIKRVEDNNFGENGDEIKKN